MALFNRSSARGATDIDPEFQPLVEAAHLVHEALGPCFDAGVYAEALSVELEAYSVDCRLRPRYVRHYKGRELSQMWEPALVANNEIVIDIVSETPLKPRTEQHMVYSMRLAECRKGLLLNFSEAGLQYRRFVAMDSESE
jgi:GxxExxY protein